MKITKYLALGVFLVFISCGGDKPIPKEEKLPVKKEEMKPVEIIKNETKEEKPLIFCVQIGAYKKGNLILKGVGNVRTIKEDSLFVYRFGAFSTYKEAWDAKRNILKTYPDAFILALKDGKRVAISEELIK